jgi:hypothetical protein
VSEICGEDKILQLNREVASRNSEIAGLRVTLQRMREAGGYVENEEIGVLTSIIEERYPADRVTKQRREIYNLHRVIKGLKDELREARGE